ncbi:hypothetical protein OSTOST_23944 [Ostertagia ostertagi]
MLFALVALPFLLVNTFAQAGKAHFDESLKELCQEFYDGINAGNRYAKRNVARVPSIGIRTTYTEALILKVRTYRLFRKRDHRRIEEQILMTLKQLYKKWKQLQQVSKFPPGTEYGCHFLHQPFDRDYYIVKTLCFFYQRK